MSTRCILEAACFGCLRMIGVEGRGRGEVGGPGSVGLEWMGSKRGGHERLMVRGVRNYVMQGVLLMHNWIQTGISSSVSFCFLGFRDKFEKD